MSSKMNFLRSVCAIALQLAAVTLAGAQTMAAPTTSADVAVASTSTPQPRSVMARTSTVAAAPPQSSDSITLRVEQHMGSTRIIRGVNGPIVWSQGLLFTSGNFEHVVAASPAALAQAREFNHKNRRGTVNFAIGLGTWVTSLFIARRYPTDTKYAVATVLGFAGGGFMFYSQRDRNAAATALSRSVLLYNGDIAR